MLREETDPSDNQVAARDEILQVMYWLRGEGIATEIQASDLSRWINLEQPRIHSLLVELAECKLLEPIDTPDAGAVRFRLTDSGVREGGRRFADEFAELTKAGHYECNDPNCECKVTGNPADCVHQH